MQVKCPCGTEFQVKPAVHASGRGRYCSRKCLYRFRPAPGSKQLANRPVYEDGTAWTEVERVPGLGVCHEWQGHRNRHGYGTIWRDGKRWLAHRKVWTDKVGPIPEGALVLHHCDNPPCVRVEHLHVGSHMDNTTQMYDRGRAYTGEHYGELNPSAKLTREQVDEIRALYESGQASQKMLSGTYGVTQAQISSIVRYKAWRK